jgi:hypothetical protein
MAIIAQHIHCIVQELNPALWHTACASFSTKGLRDKYRNASHRSVNNLHYSGIGS